MLPGRPVSRIVETQQFLGTMTGRISVATPGCGLSRGACLNSGFEAGIGGGGGGSGQCGFWVEFPSLLMRLAIRERFAGG